MTEPVHVADPVAHLSLEAVLADALETLRRPGAVVPA